MTMPLQISANRIARELRDTEAKFDAALLASARLMQELIAARQHPDVDVHTGQKALIRLVRAQSALVNGSSDIFRVHDEMVGVNREIGILPEEELTTGSGLTAIDVVKAA
jgi:hypothetical protein